MRRPERGWLVLAGVVWLVGMAGGIAALSRYALTPGEAHAAPRHWPEDVRVPRTEGRPTLVMLAHPRCACTRASVGELAVLMARARGRVDAFVLFLKPEATGTEWEEGELWRAASAIPGVTVLKDAGGEQARRFGAATSGHVLLYDAGGRLRFSGGITLARGHAGDNPGRDVVEAWVREGEEQDGEARSAVYGCALEAPLAARAGVTP
jgi:hypothetical protein